MVGNDLLPDFFLDVEDIFYGDLAQKQRKMDGQGKQSESSDVNDLSQLFEKIKDGCNEEVVSNIKAVYQFNLTEEGPWYLDLKSGSGKWLQASICIQYSDVERHGKSIVFLGNKVL